MKYVVQIEETLAKHVIVEAKILMKQLILQKAHIKMETFN